MDLFTATTGTEQSEEKLSWCYRVIPGETSSEYEDSNIIEILGKLKKSQEFTIIPRGLFKVEGTGNKHPVTSDRPLYYNLRKKGTLRSLMITIKIKESSSSAIQFENLFTRLFTKVQWDHISLQPIQIGVNMLELTISYDCRNDLGNHFALSSSLTGTVVSDTQITFNDVQTISNDSTMVLDDLSETLPRPQEKQSRAYHQDQLLEFANYVEKSNQNGFGTTQKYDGINGTQKYDGINGTQKYDGINGTQKYDGINGTQKYDGINGTQKYDGIEFNIPNPLENKVVLNSENSEQQEQKGIFASGDEEDSGEEKQEEENKEDSSNNDGSSIVGGFIKVALTVTTVALIGSLGAV